MPSYATVRRYMQAQGLVRQRSRTARDRPGATAIDAARQPREVRSYEVEYVGGEPRLCLLLLGQTELRRRLTMTVHEALAQRIVVRYHMPALTRDELSAYLTHRLRLASAAVPLFDPSAEEAIYQATGGLPRKINLLAHHTLLAAALTRAKLATADHVQAALPEIA
jgi:type II secretory pathway predicted ATPase ExeA